MELSKLRYSRRSGQAWPWSASGGCSYPSLRLRWSCPRSASNRRAWRGARRSQFGVPQMGGFKRWGLKQIWGYLRKKAFFPACSGFPKSFQTLRKRAKKAEKGEKGRFRPICRMGGQTPLKPPFVTPPFAAAQPLGKRKHTPPCSSEELLFAERERGATEERSRW